MTLWGRCDNFADLSFGVMAAAGRRPPTRAALLAAPLLCAALMGVPAGAQTAAECMQAGEDTPEDFGPTDITAVTGNQALSAGINDEGTVTVLRWPSPSYYDQIKYRTVDRAEPHMGSLPNEGAFIGVAWRPDAGSDWEFAWMRDAALTNGWVIDQRYADPDGDEIVTTFESASEGLTVTLRDVVSSSHDALIRRVNVTRAADSDARKVRVFSFANFNPVFSKSRQAPYQDWCTEERNDAGASYDTENDAVTATRAGIDESTGEQSSVALAMGFTQTSSGHQIGQDSYEAGTSGASAYDDGQDGELTGVDLAAGQADAALSRDLDLTGTRSGSAAAVITAATDSEGALRTLDKVRSTGAPSLVRAKKEWWARWLKGARLPAGGGDDVRALAKRALVSIRQATDEGGLIVSSISTQPSFSLDWVRDGAYINRALHEAGHIETARRHNIRYARLQATTAEKPPGGETTPPGNWSQNFYADGVVGGPIPYEIDSTGLGIWTLWDHYRQTRDADYLLEVYEAIQRGAQYLTDVCRDPATGLHCAAPEGDGPNPSQTLRGAQAVWLGLDSAARAADIKASIEPSGRAVARANAKKWRERRDEIADAVLNLFYDQDCRCFTRDPGVGGTFLWPARALAFAGHADLDQAGQNWTEILPAIENRAAVGGDESQALLGNATVWTSPTHMRRLRRGLRWVARIPTTNDTTILGSAWFDPGGEPPPPPSAIITMQGQPHVPSLAKFYLAALETYGTERWSQK